MIASNYRIFDPSIVMAMDFSQLKHFVCIAQLGGFSKAEQALDISQP